MNTLNVQALLNLAAGAPLVVIAGAAILFHKVTKWLRRLLIVGIACGGVLVVNNSHLFAGR